MPHPPPHRGLPVADRGRRSSGGAGRQPMPARLLRTSAQRSDGPSSSRLSPLPHAARLVPLAAAALLQRHHRRPCCKQGGQYQLHGIGRSMRRDGQAVGRAGDRVPRLKPRRTRIGLSIVTAPGALLSSPRRLRLRHCAAWGRTASGIRYACLALLRPPAAAAQPLGTYRWQLEPYCNAVTFDGRSTRGPVSAGWH